MEIALWIVQGILAVLYLLAGSMKAFQTAKARESMPWAKRHPENYVRMIGAFEILGAIGLIVPVLTGILPWLTPLAAAGLAVVQLLAIFMEHLPNKETKVLPMNALLAILAVVVFVGRLPLFK